MATVSATEHGLAPGTRLGDYEIERLIAVGPMGAVYRARDVRDGGDVALKRLTDPRRREQFEIEARLLSELSHPRVVRVLDHFADPSGVYTIVMEHVAGVDLARMLWDRGTPGLAVEPSVRWICEACEALHYVHGQHVVHGDLKPRNLLAGADGVVLVDFGVAVRLEEGEGDAVGATPLFMAPEVFAGDPVSPRSDVYGAAATLWTLLSGSPPVYGEDIVLHRAVEGVTPELEEAIRHGLALDPSERIAGAAELATALGRPLDERRGTSLSARVQVAWAPCGLLEAIVRAAAGALDASSASIALAEPQTGDLLYVASWGAGAEATAGLRLPAGVGIAGAVAQSGAGEAIGSCRADPRFAVAVAEQSGYVPHTMLVLPVRDGERVLGVLAVLDRRDGEPYLPADIPRLELFCELTVAALRPD